MTRHEEIDLGLPYKHILESLEDKGFESYLVGGCIRDYLLGREVYDIDITTRARPDDIRRIFADKKVIDFGQKYGTIKVIDKSIGYEITTFRKDGSYKDKRHPDGVSFSDSIYEDLQRRDFTINAMAYRRGEIIDPFGGKAELGKKIIRTVGDPYERIGEDMLRSMRAVRFATSLGFDIEEDLKSAIRDRSSEIESISADRIRDELSKILLAEKPSRGIRILDELGLLDYILPEVKAMVGFDQHSSFHHMDLFEHSLAVMEKLPSDLALRLAGLFHDTGKVSTMFIDDRGEGRFFGHPQDSEKIIDNRLRKLHYPKKIIEEVKILALRHMDSANTYTKKSVRKHLRMMGEETFRKLLVLQMADTLSTSRPNPDNIEGARELIDEVKELNIPIKRSSLAINGNDLKEIGYKEGKIIGDSLSYIENLVEDEVIANDKEEIIKFLTKKALFLDR